MVKLLQYRTTKARQAYANDLYQIVLAGGMTKDQALVSYRFEVPLCLRIFDRSPNDLFAMGELTYQVVHRERTHGYPA